MCKNTPKNSLPHLRWPFSFSVFNLVLHLRYRDIYIYIAFIYVTQISEKSGREEGKGIKEQRMNLSVTTVVSVASQLAVQNLIINQIRMYIRTRHMMIKEKELLQRPEQEKQQAKANKLGRVVFVLICWILLVGW